MELPHASAFGELVGGQIREAFGTAKVWTRKQVWTQALVHSALEDPLQAQTNETADDEPDTAVASAKPEPEDDEEEADTGVSFADTFMLNHDPSLAGLLEELDDDDDDMVDEGEEDQTAGKQARRHTNFIDVCLPLRDNFETTTTWLR